jgi:hypothetical protein
MSGQYIVTNVAPTSKVCVRDVFITNCEQTRSTAWCGVVWHKVLTEFRHSEYLRWILQAHTNTQTL